jgi:hypothetical protein
MLQKDCRISVQTSDMSFQIMCISLRYEEHHDCNHNMAPTPSIISHFYHNVGSILCSADRTVIPTSNQAQFSVFSPITESEEVLQNSSSASHNRTVTIISLGHLPAMSCGTSGSIVSDYRLDDWVIKVRSPTGPEDFSCSPCIQTSSEAHPASYPMGTGGPFSGEKARPGRDADHSPPSSGQG